MEQRMLAVKVDGVIERPKSSEDLLLDTVGVARFYPFAHFGCQQIIGHVLGIVIVHVLACVFLP
jgi:hypothetical protein